MCVRGCVGVSEYVCMCVLPLQFEVLRVSHTGEYTCQATVFLPGFEPIVSMTSYYVDVESKSTQSHDINLSYSIIAISLSVKFVFQLKIFVSTTANTLALYSF